MKARLRQGVILHDDDADWIEPGRWYEAEWSEATRHPRRVILVHPDNPTITKELPGRTVEVER